MTASKPTPLVPKLRFPEFREAGEWERRRLGRVGEFIGGGTPNTSVPEYWDGDIQWFTPTEVKDRNLSKSKGAIASQGLNNSSAKLLPESEVNAFWHYWLVQHSSELTKRASGSAFLEIGKTELREIPALRPDQREQQRIADCLGSLDDLIAAEGRRLEALRRHKQGLMQQLFPQPGETVPRLRFPEFRDEPSWSTPLLADLYGFKPTNTLSRDKLNHVTGTIRSIHCGDIHTKFKPLFRVCGEHVPYVSPDSPANGIDDAAFCEEGDIVLADASEDLNDIGKAIEVVSLDGERVVAGMHTILATRLGSIPVVGFGGQLFQSTAVRTGIKKVAQCAKVYGISAKRISTVPIPVPPTEAEQQKIAICLGSLDNLIVAESRRIEALRQHKQGLMQQMFPDPVRK